MKEIHEYKSNQDAEKIEVGLNIFTGCITQEQMKKVCKILGIEYDFTKFAKQIGEYFEKKA